MAIDFMSAGGTVLDTTTAGAVDIKFGKTAYNGDGELVTGTYALPNTTAGAGDILKDKTAVNSSGILLTGMMVDQGAKTVSLAPGGSYTIPAGYHNGNGKVTAKRSYTTVYLGQQTEYWTPFTYDVKSNYGAVYDKLSRSNFYAVPYAWSGNCIDVTTSASGDCHDYIFYNANTGILTVEAQSYGKPGAFISAVLAKVYMIY